MLVIAVWINIIAGLCLEAWGASAGHPWIEHAVGAVTVAHLAYYLARPPKIGTIQVSRAMLLACLALATFGELVLSAAWGVYKYRQSVLPLFVPPGHVLLFLSGLSCCQLRWCREHAARVLPLAAAPLLFVQFLNGRDYLSAALFAILLACLRWGKDKALYAVMFVLALVLELIGTKLATWTWTPMLPYVGLASANPPLAAGVFYALLDLLTVAIVSAIYLGRSTDNLQAINIPADGAVNGPSTEPINETSA